MTSLDDMRRELREKYERLGFRNPDKETELEARTRCFTAGHELAGKFKEAFRILEGILEVVEEGEEVNRFLPLELEKRLLKEHIDSIRKEVDMSHSGFEDGYPPCVQDRGRFKIFERHLDETYRHLAADELDEAHFSLALAVGAFKLALKPVR